MDEAALIEKLRRVEAFFAGETTEGEKVAASHARQRILARLKTLEETDPPVEHKLTMPDMWSRRLLVSLLRRYDLRPYRYSGQRHTTVMVKVPERFVRETLWPEFQRFDEMLSTYLSEVTSRVVSQVIHQDDSEAEVVRKQHQISD